MHYANYAALLNLFNRELDGPYSALCFSDQAEMYSNAFERFLQWDACLAHAHKLKSRAGLAAEPDYSLPSSRALEAQTLFFKGQVCAEAVRAFDLLESFSVDGVSSSGMTLFCLESIRNQYIDYFGEDSFSRKFQKKITDITAKVTVSSKKQICSPLESCVFFLAGFTECGDAPICKALATHPMVYISSRGMGISSLLRVLAGERSSDSSPTWDDDFQDFPAPYRARAVGGGGFHTAGQAQAFKEYFGEMGTSVLLLRHPYTLLENWSRVIASAFTKIKDKIPVFSTYDLKNTSPSVERTCFEMALQLLSEHEKCITVFPTIFRVEDIMDDKGTFNTFFQHITKNQCSFTSSQMDALGVGKKMPSPSRLWDYWPEWKREAFLLYFNAAKKLNFTRHGYVFN